MMKQPLQRRIWLYLMTLTIVGGMLGGAKKANHFLQRSQVISDCSGSSLSLSHGPRLPLHPQQVVVEPWKGRHNVYALFLVPNGYQPDEFVAIALANSQTYCGHTEVLDNPQAMNFPVPPEHYAVRGMLRTRTTIGLLSEGRKAELERPENWTLAIQKNWW
jgi:hypothetical protein